MGAGAGYSVDFILKNIKIEDFYIDNIESEDNLINITIKPIDKKRFIKVEKFNISCYKYDSTIDNIDLHCTEIKCTIEENELQTFIKMIGNYGIIDILIPSLRDINMDVSFGGGYVHEPMEDIMFIEDSTNVYSEGNYIEMDFNITIEVEDKLRKFIDSTCIDGNEIVQYKPFDDSDCFEDEDECINYCKENKVDEYRIGYLYLDYYGDVVDNHSFEDEVIQVDIDTTFSDNVNEAFNYVTGFIRIFDAEYGECIYRISSNNIWYLGKDPSNFKDFKTTNYLVVEHDNFSLQLDVDHDKKTIKFNLDNIGIYEPALEEMQYYTYAELEDIYNDSLQTK